MASVLVCFVNALKYKRIDFYLQSILRNSAFEKMEKKVTIFMLNSNDEDEFPL